ncbi:MAG TPA: peptide-methionine (S)-S-oxide reductase MsrA [Bryobacteraceae bacterium]|nr:peptide-methionine (S)-S-oxide reductase MsrA [Bryobacteraceae bacterium]
MKRALITVVLTALAGLSVAKAAADFPEPKVDAQLAAASSKETLVVAGGCFWGVEAVFDRVKGVTNVVSGFAGGEKSTAHYEKVSTGTTGHAESVKITYDPSKVTLGQLLMVYFSVAHNPTELNRQGPDVGTQYRSAIFYQNDDQKRIAEAYIQQLNDAHVFAGPIVTKLTPFNGFYAAEPYHQHYLDYNRDNPYIIYNDLPKLAALKKQYPQLCKR